MAVFQEYVAYSPIHDCEMVRLSVCDDHGSEFWIQLPWDDGKNWRVRRYEALDIIEEAIGMGLQPGEVRVH